MSSEESNKMSKKTPSQDSKYKIEWDFEDMKKAVMDNIDDYDKLVGG